MKYRSNKWNKWTTQFRQLALPGMMIGLWVPMNVVVAQPRDFTRTPTVQARIARSPADTDDFAFGHQDFTAYKTPGFCLVAVQNTAAILRGNIQARNVLDTLQNALSDTLGMRGIAGVARACSVHFTAAGTQVSDLSDLFLLALSAQNDTLAQSVLTRQAMQDFTPAARATRYLSALNQVLMPDADVRLYGPTDEKVGLIQSMRSIDQPIVQSLRAYIEVHGSEPTVCNCRICYCGFERCKETSRIFNDRPNSC